VDASNSHKYDSVHFLKAKHCACV